MARSLIEERYTWPVRTVLLGGGSLWATSYQMETRRHPSFSREALILSAAVTHHVWNPSLSRLAGEAEKRISQKGVDRTRARWENRA
jgi:hypothetical protein